MGGSNESEPLIAFCNEGAKEGGYARVGVNNIVLFFFYKLFQPKVGLEHLHKIAAVKGKPEVDDTVLFKLIYINTAARYDVNVVSLAAESL